MCEKVSRPAAGHLAATGLCLVLAGAALFLSLQREYEAPLAEEGARRAQADRDLQLEIEALRARVTAAEQALERHRLDELGRPRDHKHDR